jgi:hypothetical protein
MARLPLLLRFVGGHKLSALLLQPLNFMVNEFNLNQVDVIADGATIGIADVVTDTALGTCRIELHHLAPHI